ncbi:MAG: 6-pyruvoyl-tetrahydropterin synthase-related protein [Candidatus Curtissbacteria bacterium]|nr:6-pyruvoyl-tetrahydropterin synthase-related protein [Candidatus Berkelbacteria bacterium]MCR4324805.1 6-pyruvoyl-tetrahydropterin synthase-related protein [Candidatus Curtissbacteria bacterium]
MTARFTREAIPLGIIVAVVFALLRGSLHSGLPAELRDVASAGYLSKVAMINEANSWYTQNWYLGFEIDRWYQPLTSFWILFLGKVLGDDTLAFNVLSFSAYLSLAVGLYLWLRIEFSSVVAALLSSGLFLTTHVTIVTFQGYYWQTPQLLGWALTPWAMIAFRSSLRNRSRSAPVVFGVLMGLIGLCNWVALLEAMMLSVSYGVAIFVSRRSEAFHPEGLWRLTTSVLIMAAVTAWWLIPALEHGLSPFFRTGLGTFDISKILDFFGSADWHDWYVVKIPSVRGLWTVAVCAIVVFRCLEGKRGVAETLAISVIGISFFLMVELKSDLAGRLSLDVALGLAILSGDAYNWLRRSWSKAVYGGVALALVAISALDDSAHVRVDREAYKTSPEYIEAELVSGSMEKGDRAYIMWSHRNRMSEWFNFFHPELSQVLGASDQTPVNPDVRRIDYLMKHASSREDAQELDLLLRKHSVTHLVVDSKETASVINQRYALSYEGNSVQVFKTGHQPRSEAVAKYSYWHGWRIAGVLVSLLLVFVSAGYYTWSEAEERLEEREINGLFNGIYFEPESEERFEEEVEESYTLVSN